jgi:hypothetical protein
MSWLNQLLLLLALAALVAAALVIYRSAMRDAPHALHTVVVRIV